MDPQSRGFKKVVELIDKGVAVRDPHNLDIGDDVDVARIAGRGVTIYPGCRLYGAKMVISPGVTLGAEGPVTLDDCALGPSVELKGGYFRQSVFLEKASMGSGAQVREGCLIEEEASGAHSVGLKQTILFPFVTVGSLVNFCDCLMAGGTSRRDHSEVGSAYIHFNFTPDGDKTTASLFGDVPRGVMLDRPPIFLGGQGGAVGPVRVGYGTVVAAGSILRRDIVEDGRLVMDSPPPRFERDYRPRSYANLTRVVRNNVVYLANLVALEEWYRAVRRPFFARQEMGELVHDAALAVLSSARRERTKWLETMADKVPADDAAAREYRGRAAEVCGLFTGEAALSAALTAAAASGERFLTAFRAGSAGSGEDYVQAIQSLTPDLSARGTEWLQQIVDALCRKAEALLPTIDLFRD
jgi:bifunctional UDP-N-acetylglucosamine pyrophosphorylase/glucosamine-1-phosphate N-acetyltransferase